ENDAPTIDSTAPVMATEDVQYDYVASATDADGLAPLVWSVAPGDTCAGSFVGSAYSFTPTGPAPPADCELAIQVCDSSSPAACDTETATVTITATNDDPTTSGIADQSNAEGDGPLSVDVTGSFSDPDGDGLTLTTASALPDGLTFNGSAFVGTLSFVSAGTYPITVTANDGRSEEGRAGKDWSVGGSQQDHVTRDTTEDSSADCRSR